MSGTTTNPGGAAHPAGAAPSGTVGAAGTATGGDPLAALRAAARARTEARAESRAAHAARRAQNARPQRSADELRAIVERGQAELHGSGLGAPDEATAEQVVAWAVREFGDSIAVACSMADAVLPHVVAQQAPWVDVLFLETGYHFPETSGTRDAVEQQMEVTIVDVLPQLTVAQQDEAHGKDLWSRDPAACCAMRKVEPLTRTLGEYEVWVTGVRRDEAPTRTNTPLVTWDEKNGLVKINPLAAWSFDDLLGYAADHQVVLNPLLNDGYPSIGCAPCTRRVAPGEDPRAGRWAGLDKTECGLHV
ncbi:MULTISPECIES: phosphoadenylyl-sulfate reductase [Oerskovia]|uniref:Adenosine 5'-phosphosulfate reductase n=1 Tax=Oerskovia gallyi TaxID=2762226 RepID=A0ABR8UZ67_9CELL|nr:MULTISPECIES: phosphoadenylyl-sulfate reductase [Oerskovia]MBD7997740.1 phosphoadenylyl-sulfate reductase [Oerskovia gallyi]MBM7496563.1 phosphoadenosine phosphosulfate reductase [Oerskovia paurometabola]